MSTQKRKLYLRPDEGMIKGVCAGLARYFDVPVFLIRIIAVISIFAGMFWFTIAAYIVMSYVLDPAPAYTIDDGNDTSESVAQMLNTLELNLQNSEVRVRRIERYVTSESYTLHRRFKDL